MSNMRNLGINKVTGGRQLGTAAVLLSVSGQPLELKNAQKTKYRIVTCRVTLPNGETKVYNAIMYEKNFQKGGFKIGDSLSLKIEINEAYANPLLILSHLHAGERATNADFEAAFSDFPAETTPAVVAAGTPIKEMQPEGQDA
jgi:hypothetical protein